MSGDVFRRWRLIAKCWVLFVQKLVIELFCNNMARPVFDFADVYQHAGRWIHRTGENKIRDVISPGTVASARFRPECDQVFALRPIAPEQSARGRKFEPLADGQEHDSANTLEMIS